MLISVLCYDLYLLKLSAGIGLEHLFYSFIFYRFWYHERFLWQRQSNGTENREKKEEYANLLGVMGR
jgi:hypothetical protein